MDTPNRLHGMRRFFLLLLFSISTLTGAVAQSFWTGLNGPYGGYISDVVSPSAGIMLVATGNGVYRSADSGATWARMTLGTDNQFIDLEVDPSSSGTKIYASTNNGARIYLSSDAGLNWTQFAASANGVTSIVTRIKVTPSGFIYLADAITRLLKSTTAGGSTFTSPVTVGLTVNDLDVDASNNVYVSTSSGGIKVYPGTGSVFNTASTGSIISSSTVLSTVINSTGVVFALTSTGPHKSLNGGAPSGVTYASMIGTNLTDVTFSGLIDLNASGDIYVANNNSLKMWTSTAASSGALWNVGGIAYPYSFTATASFFQTSSTWYLGFGQGGLFKTTNTGGTWTASSSGIKALPATKLFITATNGYLLMGWPSGLGLFRSVDNGATWNLNASPAANTNRNINGFIKLSDNSILGYGNGVIRSIDQGLTWALQGPQVLSELVSSDGVNLFSYSGTNLLKSINQGVAWTTTAITGLPGTPNKIQVDASNNVYFRVNNEIWKVLSGATTATNLTALTAATIQDIQVVGTGVYVLGNSNTLFISTNGGSSFTGNNGPTGTNTALWVYNSLSMAIRTTVNNLYFSTDGGGIWTSQPLLDAQGSVTDITISSSTVLYAATANSVMHKSTQVVLPPAAPTSLSIASKSFDQVQLLWNDNANNESDYTVEISIGDNLHYTGGSYGFGGVTFLQNKINFTYTGLTKNTLYFFRVKAVNNVSSSAYSNEVSVTTLDLCAPTIPNNRSWSAVAVADPGSTASGPGPFTSATVNIVSVSPNNYSISNYDLGVDPSGAMGVGLFVESCGVTSFLEQSFGNFANGNGTWNGTTLVLKWQNSVDDNFFQGTTTLTLNPTDPAPAAPALNAYLYSATEVFLNWSSVPFATSYEIRRSTVSGGSPPGTYPLLTTLNYPAVTYIDKTVVTGTQYYYVVVAKNATGSSGISVQAGIAAANVLFRPLENDIQLNFEPQQGASWGDLDGDGDEDIALPAIANNAGQTVPPSFYENMGNGKDFTRRYLTVLVNENTSSSRGINIFDFDNDGKLDLYIGRIGKSVSDLLLINNGGWNFTKNVVTESQQSPAGLFWRSPVAIDYDNDGKVDVFIGNDPGAIPANARGQLLKNSGGSSFTEILTGPLVTDLYNARNATAADYDNDGDQDIFVHDTPSQPNRLYKNNGDGTFSRVTDVTLDNDIYNGARTSSWGDIDNDGDMDLYIGSQSAAPADKLYQNNGNGTFTSLTQPTSVTEAGTSTFGSTFGDIDNDGDLDLIAINGGANSIFLNNGSGVFTKSGASEMITHPLIFEVGVSLSDFDQDGFLDIYPPKGTTSAVDLPNFLYKNTLTASASRNWIEIKLVGTQSNKSAIGARITVSTATPLRTQIREISSRTGYGSANSLIAHVGLGTATTISSIQVKWPSGIIQTLTNVTAINRIITIAEDNTPPAVVTLNPAHNTVGVAYNTKLEITFNEVPYPVAGKKIKLFDGATLVEQFDATVGVISGNKVSFTPAALLASTKQYNISVDAGAFTDIYSNATPAMPSANWQFKSLDNTPPAITFANPNAAITKGFAVPVVYKPTVTDNSGNVTSFVMSYRNVENKPFTDITLLNVTGQQTFNIPAIDEMGLNFYFTAKDADNNIARLPSAAGTYFTTRIQYTGTNLPAMDLVKGTGTATDYQIISIPWDIANKDIASNFSELSGGNTRFRFIRYHQLPTQGWDEYPGTLSTFARGEGYFVNVTDVSQIIFTDGFSPRENRDSLFVLSLKKGWNQIGNPYTTPIQWGDVLAYNNITSGLSLKLLIFSGGYQTAADPGIIQPTHGAFVLADNDLSNIKIPFQNQTSGGRVNQYTFSKNIGEDRWDAEFILNQQDAQFRVAAIGMSPEASAGIDMFDMAVPPRLNDDFIEMSVPHPEHFMKRFARDVVQTQEEYSWRFTVDVGGEGTAELTWDNETFGTNAKELYLLDEKLQKLVNMRERSTYSFDPRQSSQFKIYFGENLEKKIKPSQVVLGKAYPNPTTGSTNIAFTLPEQSSDYQVKLEVYDLMGKKVSTLLNGNLAPGFYTVEWDAAGQALTNGLYTYRLSVAGASGLEVHSDKIVLKK